MPFTSEGGHRHDVGWHICPVCILELKIFGLHSIVFAFQIIFSKTLDGTCNVTKIVEIDEGMNK
jgi:hypothetical protein